MPEILVKTHTRQRDPESEYYMRDWSAGDVVGAPQPDGFYTKNKYQGWKHSGIVLLMDKIPSDYTKGIKWETVYEWDYQKLETVDKQRIVTRSQMIVDLPSILTDAQLKAVFDHSVMCEPITITQSYIDVFKNYTERTLIHPYDRHGSFDNEEVDVGPNGDANANTFSEFESNLAASLSGPVIGNADEAYSDTTAVVVDGFTQNGHRVTMKFTGVGRHAGVWDSSKGRLEITGDHAITTARILTVDGFQISVDPDANDESGIRSSFGITGDIQVSNSIIKNIDTDDTYASYGFYTAHVTTWKVWNTIIYGFGQATWGIGARVASSADMDIHNCTFQDLGVGIFTQDTATVDMYNSCVFNTGDDFSDAAGTITCDYCASDDANASGGYTNGVDWNSGATDWAANFTDYSAANPDLSVKDTNADIYNSCNGDQSGGLYTDDITGFARDGNWDMGAFEFQAAGGRPLPQRVLSGPFQGPLGGPL